MLLAGLVHTLCGLAPEAFGTGDADTPVVIALSGEEVGVPQIGHQPQLS